MPIFIESLYFKRFGRERPDIVRTIEEAAASQRAKKAARKEEAEQLSLADIGVMLEIQRLETAGPYFYETAEPYAGIAPNRMLARWPNCGASRFCDGARAGLGFMRGPAKYGASVLGRLRSKSTRRLDAKL